MPTAGKARKDPEYGPGLYQGKVVEAKPSKTDFEKIFAKEVSQQKHKSTGSVSGIFE